MLRRYFPLLLLAIVVLGCGSMAVGMHTEEKETAQQQMVRAILGLATEVSDMKAELAEIKSRQGTVRP